MNKRLMLGAALLSLLATVPAAVAQWTSVGDGIDYREYTLSGPKELFVARMDRANTNAFIESSIGQGRLSGGTERVSDQAARYDDAIGFWGETWGNRNDVVVAINGSYYDGSGVPFSGVVHSGSYDKRFDNVTGQSGFVWDLNRQANIGECVNHVASKQFVTYATATTQNFNGINVAPADGQLTIFTPQYDDSTGTSSSVSEVLVEMTTPFLIKPTPNYVVGYVRQIRQNQGDTSIPFDHIVLSALGSAETKLLSNVNIGDEIHISQEIKSYERDCSTVRSLDWTKAYASVSGNWAFLVDNVIQYGIDPLNERHPRTAIALNSSYVFYIVCDGRSAQSIGMTIDELAEFCKNTLGASWGVNQDGGGSSTIVVNGTVKNNPSDGSQRYVANGMLMCNLVAMSQTSTFSTNDTVETIAAANLRLGPGTNYEVITTLSSGTQGTVLNHAMNGVLAKSYNWWKVDFGTYTGWIAESLLSGGGSCTAPSITAHPDNETVSAGQTASFTVSATGDTPLSYQWQKDSVNLSDGGDISGAATDTLHIANCETADEGNYRCVVTNACGNATSNSALLTVTSGGGGTVFIVESRSGGQNYANYSETGTWGNSNSYKSTAEGCTPGIGHRWCSLNTSSKTAVFSFTPSETGTYEVFTTNCLTWNSGNPLIHHVAHAGGTTDVGVCQNANCSPNAVNVWYSLGQYTLNSGTEYTVTLNGDTDSGSGPYGNAGRSDAVKWLSVSTAPEPPTITQDPSNQTVTEGQTATFTVTASGTPPLSYQWQKNTVNLSDGGDISGATTDTLQIANCESSDEGGYRCVVTNAYGSDTSNTATLTVNAQTALLFDDFDSYANQSEFAAVWTINVGSVTLTTSRSYSSPNSVYIGTSAGRADRNFTPAYGSDANPLELSFHFYDTSAYNLDRQYVQLYAYSGSSVTQLICLGNYNSTYAMRDYYAARVPYAPGPNWIVLNDSGAPERSIGWHELKAVIKSTKIDFYVDGVLAKANVSYAYSAGDHTFSQVRIGSGYSSNSEANYDDISITGGN